MSPQRVTSSHLNQFWKQKLMGTCTWNPKRVSVEGLNGLKRAQPNAIFVFHCPSTKCHTCVSRSINQMPCFCSTVHQPNTILVFRGPSNKNLQEFSWQKSKSFGFGDQSAWSGHYISVLSRIWRYIGSSLHNPVCLPMWKFTD